MKRFAIIAAALALAASSGFAAVSGFSSEAAGVKAGVKLTINGKTGTTTGGATGLTDPSLPKWRP